MKKINIMTAALVGLLAFASCDADRDDNPTLTVPESFNLLKPEMGDNVIDLVNCEYVRFQAEKAANYGFPTETSYWIQIAGDDNADFANKKRIFSVSTKGNSINYNAPANELDYCVMQVKGWEEEGQVEKDRPINLNIRMVSCPKNLNDSANYVYSNVQQIKVYPYFIKESLPQFWYLVGGMIADGSWGNDINEVGNKSIPMYVKKGQEYDKFTGDGVVQYIGYFNTGSFKILSPKMNWNFGISYGNLKQTGDCSGFKARWDADFGADDNITVDDAGYYVLEIDTKEHELKAQAYNSSYEGYKEPILYESMKIGDTDMTPMSTVAGSINHDWLATITLEAKTELKFTSGNTVWGSSIFPCAIGNMNDDAKAIPCSKGTYKVYFNDITGAYSFVEQK